LFGAAIRRGWGRRCPHCGRGPLYSRWIHLLPQCPHCGLVYERNPGDTWLFINVGDRVFIGLWIVIIYFGVPRRHPFLAVFLFLVVGVALVWTTPHRWGVGTALHYLSRAYSNDPDDPIPGGDRIPDADDDAARY
jgi:uncharacterized protein (DUF983 family)